MTQFGALMYQVSREKCGRASGVEGGSFAHGLAVRGVRAADRVVFPLMNRHEMIAAYSQTPETRRLRDVCAPSAATITTRAHLRKLITRNLSMIAALSALFGNPVAIAQTTGNATWSAGAAGPAASSSLTRDTRSIGGGPVGRGVFVGGFATGYAVAIAGKTFGPIEAISYQLGSKRAVGYFDSRNGKCEITLMITEAIDPEQALHASAARLSLPIWPGERAALASEEGPSMELTCGADAQTVVVKCNPSCGGLP